MPKRRDRRSNDKTGEINFETILSALGEGISVQDRDFRIIYQNKEHIRVHGDHQGEYCFRAYVNAEDVCQNCPVAMVFSDKEAHTSVHVRVTETGDHHMEITAAPLIAKDGEIVASTEIVRDITGRITTERELESYRRRLEELVEEKTRDLRQKEERLNLAMMGANDGLWDWDLGTDMVYYSPRWKSMLGYAEEELQNNLNTWKILTHPEDRDSTLALVRDLVEGRTNKFEVEFRMRHRDGHYLHILSRAILLHDSEGRPLRLVGTHVDITERKRAEEALAESEASCRKLFDSSTDGIFILDLDGNFIDANRTAYERLGYAREEFLAMHISELDHPSFAARVPERLRQISEDGIAVFEAGHLRKDGSMMPVEVNSRLLEYRGRQVFLSIVRDITERKRAEEQMRSALTEKETLFRELYHRTKNNMQVITSLIKLQMAAVSDKRDIHLFNDTLNRIMSMALVHEKLYGSKELSNVNLKNYIEDLAKALLRSYQIDKDKTVQIIDIDDMVLSIDTIIPIGLIITELMSNTLKYAFPGNRQGEIRITAHSFENGEIEITYGDNGIGFPAGFDFRKTNSLGLKLVDNLVTGQLRGRLTLKSDEGSGFVISFKEPSRKKRI